MVQSEVSGVTRRLAVLGIRGKALALAGLGLCALPCVILILIWRDIVVVTGLAPLLAIGCATLAALATLIGLDLLLRPVSLTGLALGRLLGEAVPADLPLGQAGHEGRLMGDAQRVIDELIALRAEHQDCDDVGMAATKGVLAQALQANADPAQAVVVLRITNGAEVPFGANGNAIDRLMLSESTRRLESLCGGGLPLGAVGPTDIAFVLPLQHVDLAATSDFANLMQAVLSDLGRPFLTETAPVAPLLRGGVGIWSRGDSPDRVIDNALAALDTTAPTSPLVIYNDALRARTHDHSVLVQELRSAVRNEEFELYYQPVMDICTHQPIGAEALIRWHSPARGFVAPDVFIPLAEACGLIDPIGLWVLRDACREAAGWDPAMRVAVNMGARQFLDEDLVWHVSDAIRTAGIRADQLEIELTHSVAMVDHGHTRATFAALRDMGVRVAIEDLGTGRTNLAALGKLPLNTLKIDREFVADVHRTRDSQAICDALLALGAGLGVGVVAEGAEKAAEVDYLARRGCSMFQGYYFARPVPAAVLAATFGNLRLREAG